MISEHFRSKVEESVFPSSSGFSTSSRMSGITVFWSGLIHFIPKKVLGKRAFMLSGCLQHSRREVKVHAPSGRYRRDTYIETLSSLSPFHLEPFYSLFEPLTCYCHCQVPFLFCFVFILCLCDLLRCLFQGACSCFQRFCRNKTHEGLTPRGLFAARTTAPSVQKRPFMCSLNSRGC